MSQEDLFQNPLTFSQPDTPVSHSHKPEGAWAKKTLATSSRTSLELLHKQDPLGQFSRNVYGHISLGLDNVLDAMASEGYTTRTFTVPASGVGARHERKRIWIVGHTKNNGRDRWAETVGREGAAYQQDEPKPEVRCEPSRPSENVAYTESIGVQGYRSSGEQIAYSHAGQEVSLCSGERASKTQWETEPSLDRVVDGVPNRVDRIKGLGNAIVPQIAMNIGLTIKRCIDES